MSNINFAKIKFFDITNGTGIRTPLFVSGCERHCKGCFNEEAWDKCYGKKFTNKTIETILNSIDNDYCAGLSILGGDPLEDYNVEEVNNLIKAFRKRFKWGKTIWLWTGYTIEELVNSNKWKVIEGIDVLVDGPFELNKRNLKLKYKGSSNQRVIDIQKTITFNTLIEFKD